jgi:glutathione transport system ATP-binding protein
METRNLLEVSGLSVAAGHPSHPVPLVSDLTFSVERGETVAIVGESGSGKSVTALSIMRLIEYGGGIITAGSMDFARHKGGAVDLAQASEITMRQIRGAEVSMIFQEPMTSLNPVMSVGDQIAEAIAQHQGKSPRQARDGALSMLELVRIPAPVRALGRYPHELSGGMRQRVMIGMALCCRPSLLIADEPTTALDTTIQAQILQLIRALQHETGMSVIFITHDMGVVAEIADHMVVMNGGRRVEAGPVAEVLCKPQHPYTQRLLNAVPRLGGMRGRDLPEKFAIADSVGTAAAHNTVKNRLSPLLRLDRLTIRFDNREGYFGRVRSRVHAVEQVSLELYEGETLGLVGESGCGKSTIGRSILRLVKPCAGRIEFQGSDISKFSQQALRPLRRDIQYVFQDPFASLDPRRTVGFSIAEPLTVHGLEPGRTIETRVADLLRKVGLTPQHAARYPHELSGGQRQRICIARALAPNPKLIIADESVSALDVSIQARIVNLLIDLQQEFGIAYIFISHDMAIVERICHRVAVMYLGQIVEIGSRSDIFENPRHPYTRRLIAAVPVAEVNRRDRPAPAFEGEVPSPVRRVGDEPVVAALECVGPGHFVARHAIGALRYVPDAIAPDST